MEAYAEEYFAAMRGNLERIDARAVARVGTRLLDVFHTGAHLLIAGNGGSASNASHLACDLGKTVLGADPQSADARFRVTSLGDNVALLTAWANDAGYETVFAEEVKMLGRPGDLLLVLSVSGDSPNVVEAARAAKARDMGAVGFLGGDGGRLRELLDDYVLVDDRDYGHVESAHLVLGHLLTAWLERMLHDR